MKLLTKEIMRKLPKLYSQDGKDPKDVKIVVKFFNPNGSDTWYATEGEEQPDGDWRFFGLVRGQFTELGYFSLKQLQSVRGRWGLGVERDMWFGFDRTLAEAKEEQI